MQTLENFNAQRAFELGFRTDRKMGPYQLPILNGISCPKCLLEMYDTRPHIWLNSNPPKKDIHCECGYKAYRLA